MTISKSQILKVYWLHKDFLVSYASGIVGDRASAEDILQEAYLKFSSAAAVQDLDEPIAYLHRIVRNLSLDAKRKHVREASQISTAGDIAFAHVADSSPSPERQASSREEMARLELALEELPDRTRRVLEMYWYEGFTLRDIAGTLGISLGLTHSLVADGLDHCRLKLRGGKV
ncbi:sigma-70 family RNA polymerase sigma factor [Nisaea acidiphila]|uniref:Sigma-70 family RNA polymerase sigma factor n=1 Tax=Nisaea acidiphila TaxID=1862145 RepID=A0A9J7AUQ1_9PROT|nr:sigma-70 family RNA polymerase sigma factor [Nisaea acidiphila]UUX51055.1 sigma-70 family RNA polymerase sigma factor [Nisaea acidiphila]